MHSCCTGVDLNWLFECGVLQGTPAQGALRLVRLTMGQAVGRRHP
jgi:hypothetical protein